MAVGDDEKPKFRCLDAGRYVVAFVVAVVVVVVIVHAVATVLRPGDLVVRLDKGHVSVNVTSKDEFCIKFTLEALNPSGRVRIYFTNILANISRSLTAEEFVAVTPNRDIAVGQQDSAIITVAKCPQSLYMLQDAFVQFYSGGSIGNAILKLSGKRTVETYAGHNDTAKRVLYYCSSITVGAEEPENAPSYVPCTEQQLPASGST